MATSQNKYAQNIARARYRTSGGTSSIPDSGRHAPTIDIAGMMSKPAAGGAPLASRPIEGGSALPSPKEFNPIIDAESGEDPNAPRVETQQPIENRGMDPRFMIQGGGPRIDLSGFFPERANKSYDPSKAIGGENVPYQASGFFRGLMGDPANRKNIEAQLAQGAEWKAETARTKQRAERKQDLEDEIALREKGPNARFAAEQKRLDDKAIQDEIERNNAIDLGLVKEGNEDVLKDVDMVRKALSDEQEGKRKDRELDIRESAIKAQPRYTSLGNGVFQTAEGKLSMLQPAVMGISKAMPGRPAQMISLPEPGSVPMANLGDEEVDRITGKPKPKLGGPLPLGPENQNTAIVPRFMRGAGEVVGEGVQSFMDPLRSGTTGINQLLFNSGAQQDPEVLKRMEERTRKNPLRNMSTATPMGY